MFTRTFILILATALALWTAGCEKSDTTPADDAAKRTDEHAGHDHPEGEMHDEMHDEEMPGHSESSTTKPAAADTGGQTMCPVSGHDIDTAVYVEHEGKKVYFCCDACVDKFKENPDKYLALLPQFGGKEDPDKVEGS